MEKDELLKNQILFYRKKYSEKLEDLNEELNKNHITSYDFKCAKNGLLGRISTLNSLIDLNDESKIMDLIFDKFNVLNNSLKTLKINFLDENDKNLDIFHLLHGSCIVLLLLMTVPENPLSCCPENKKFFDIKKVA